MGNIRRILGGRKDTEGSPAQRIPGPPILYVAFLLIFSMSFQYVTKSIAILFFWLAAFLLPPALPGYEIFIYRRYEQKKALAPGKKLSVHGEFFGQLQFPANFPSYNDLTGPEDRWNFGFQNTVFLTSTTVLDAQLVTHDSGGQRTKFDWHFSVHQDISKHFALTLGHDSDHDSDYTSYLDGKPYYTNRNYIGLSLPFSGKTYMIEPFTWFFHHTNERTFLDLSGSNLKQEYGVRVGALIGEKVTLSMQVIVKSDTLFYKGQTWLADVIIRYPLMEWLELSLGAGIWKDKDISPLGNKQSYHKLTWGIAIPF
jgi:hypothetical protein